MNCLQIISIIDTLWSMKIEVIVTMKRNQKVNYLLLWSYLNEEIGALPGNRLQNTGKAVN